jgi:hypothetical protein
VKLLLLQERVLWTPPNYKRAYGTKKLIISSVRLSRKNGHTAILFHKAI